MAKCYEQKSRKEYKCGKCGRIINKGDKYFKIVEAFSHTRIRCENCKPERSELTSSDYLSWLWDLQDHFEERYDLRSEEAKDEVMYELESQQCDLQERLDNIPEQLQYADAGTLLQERIEALGEAIMNIENLDFPDMEDDEYKLGDEEKEDLSEEEIEQKEKELFEEAVDTFESDLIEIINNLE